ncbi:hypothetical protein [Plantactinospora sp. B5E13]|uniref:hypothetical protein n=1 Tax=unclassified Plantactinospora TaxID=2631981 RepID=UPI00325F86F5
MTVDAAGGHVVQVQFEALWAAARQALPPQAAALREVRRVLLATQVPTEWLGRLPGSGQAATAHAGAIVESARQLEAAATELDRIGGHVTTTADRNKQLDDDHARQQQEQGQQVAQAEQRWPEGQRDKAMAVLREIEAQHPISSAAVARNMLDKVMWFAGNMAAGQIGDHYDQEVRELLSQPPTNENLRTLAERETEFWNSPRGSDVGAMMGADTRYQLLLLSRAEWVRELPWELRQQGIDTIFPPKP